MIQKFNEWRTKRLFKIERDRHKMKKLIYSSNIKPVCSGFDSNNLYPTLVADSMSKYYRMNGYNIMYPIVINNLNQDSYQYTRLRNIGFETLKTLHLEELIQAGVGFDREKEIAYSDLNFIEFVQKLFLNMYNDGLVSFEDKEVYVDFTNKTVYPSYKTYKKDNYVFSKDTNEKLHIKKLKVLNLDVTKLGDLYDDISSLDIPQDIKDEILDMLEYDSGLRVDFYSDNKCISLNIDNPEYIAGITYLAVNPNLCDITRYTSQEELATINEFIQNKDSKESLYTGLTLKNPLTNTDIYVFASYNYDEAIHIGIPCVNENDYKFANDMGLEYIDILEEDYIINSDFLTGLKKEQAREMLISSFTEEGMATLYKKISLEKLIISSFDDLGVLVPIHLDSYNNVIVFDPKYLPINITNRYKVFINNEDELEFDINLNKMVFSEDFVKGLATIYSKVYDVNSGNIDFLHQDSQYDEFDNMIGIFKHNDASVEILFNILTNAILKKYGKNYKSFSKVVILPGLQDDIQAIEEHQRIALSMLDEIIKKNLLDEYRLYLFTQEEYSYDLSITIESLEEYQEFIKKVKDTYEQKFSAGAFDSVLFMRFKDDMNKLLSSFNLKEYTKKLIEFFNEHVVSMNINRKESMEFLIFLSIICPTIAEECYKGDNYSIFLSDWPK